MTAPAPFSEEGGEKEYRQVLEDEDQLLQERFPLEEVLGAGGEEVFCTDLADVQEGAENGVPEEESAREPDVQDQQ